MSKRKFQRPLTDDSEEEPDRILDRLECEGKGKCAAALKGSLPVSGETHKFCILQVENKSIHVLQGVLAEWSPFFEAEFSDRWNDGEGVHSLYEVTIEDFTPLVVDWFVHFLYCGKLESDMTMEPIQLLELAQMGKFYQVHLLHQMCLAWLHYRGLDNAAMRPSLEDFERYHFSVDDLIAYTVGGLNRPLSPVYLSRLNIPVQKFLAFNFNTATFYCSISQFFISCGISVAEITEDLVTIPYLQERGWRQNDIMACGFRNCEQFITVTPKFVFDDAFESIAEKRSFQERQARQDIAVQRVISKGFSVAKLLEDGCDSKWFQKLTSSSPKALYRAGYGESDLIKLGFKERLVKRLISNG